MHCIFHQQEVPMQKEEEKTPSIRRNVHGPACWCCGSRRYQLVLKSVKQTEVGHLFARCIQCHHSKEIDDYLARVLWM
jgi:hypothetical protein